MSRWTALRLALPAALLGLTLAACADPPAAEPPAEVAATVRTETPQVEDVQDVTILPAELLPRRRAVLAAEVPGVVERLSFEVGDAVATGELLAEIDTRALEVAVAEAEALDRQARDQAERAERLFERRSITREQLIDATTGRDVAASRLDSARLQLSKSRLTAPWTGRIAARRVEVGDYVVPGQPIAELVDRSRLKVRAPAPSDDVPYLEVGAPVTIRIDAFPGEELEGRVVRLAAEVDPAARTLDVEVEIPNPGERLTPGLLARMEIPRRTLEGVLLVPLAAVVDLGGDDAVYVVEEGRARRRMVETGPVTGERVVVLSGLEVGERVVVEGAQQVAEGQLVEEVSG